MESNMNWKLLLAAVFAASLGCADNGSGSPVGTGGSDGGGGVAGNGVGGNGGDQGGTGGSGEPGGSGGTGGSGGAGGSGGEGGEIAVDYGWLTDPEIWTKIGIEQPSKHFNIYKGDPERFEFPPIDW